MTHHDQSTALDQITELLAEHGFDGLASAVTVLINEVMKIERVHALGAGPYQRTEGRKRYANGFKPRTVQTRIGPLALQVPQARGVEFYPSSLEKGVRSERALKQAVAEMYVQGVSTKKVAAITEQRCGTEVTSSQSAGRPTIDNAVAELAIRPLDVGRLPELAPPGRVRWAPPHGHSTERGRLGEAARDRALGPLEARPDRVAGP